MENFFYEITANPRCTDDANAFIVQEYERVSPGEAVPRQVVFVGSFAECKSFAS